MRSFLKLTAIFLCLGLWASPGHAESKKDKDKKDPAKAEAKKRDKDKDKDKNGGGGKPGELAFPVPPGHDSKGLKIPTFADGKLKMIFNIGVANRVDDQNVKMSGLWVETYQDTGETEMSIDLPQSNLNLNTKLLTTQDGVTIRRSDFEISGKTMQFDTNTKSGTLGGGVKMIIYNRENDVPDEKGKPSAPPSSSASNGGSDLSLQPSTAQTPKENKTRE